MKAQSLTQVIKNNVHADMISKNKAGNYVFRRGYFYHGKMTTEIFSQSIQDQLTKAGLTFEVIDSGDHWAPFKGGAGIKQNSHFYVEINVHPVTEAVVQ